MALGKLFLTQSMKRSMGGIAKQYIRGSEFIKFGSAVGSVHLQHTISTPKICVQQKPLNLSEHVKNLHTSNVNRSDAAQGGNHTKLWTIERVLAAGMLGIIPAGLIFPSTAMDVLLATSLVLHTHWGIEAIAVDYIRPIIFGKAISTVAHGLVYVLSICTYVGLMFLIFNDCGFANAIRMFWKL